MDKIDIYKADGTLSDQRISCGDSIPSGCFIRVADVCFVNSKKEFLLQKRRSDDSFCPSMWGLTGGGLLAGETPVQGLIRETAEEIGIQLNPRLLTLIHTYKINSIWVDVFLSPQEFSHQDMIIQTSEMTKAIWIPLPKVKKIIGSDQFVPFLKPALEKIISIIDK